MFNLCLQVATVNGSGSQSANNIIAKSLFRMGLGVGAKNMFPSNIAGLPTWFNIRVNDQGFTSREDKYDILVAFNKETIVKDCSSLKENSVIIYNNDLKVDISLLPASCLKIGIPCKSLLAPLNPSVKLKKLLANMVYVGVLAECLEIDEETLISVINDQFNDKKTVVEINKAAIEAGRSFARENIQVDKFPFKLPKKTLANEDKIYIDGNTAAGLGLMYGGCSFLSWYPITPSSSLAETFISYADKYRRNSEGKKTYAVVQAEDELSAISMVIGASWTGARALTTTSGPGMSLMAEAAGLSYFAEVPAVIWNVQRVGPSTGLPTRTSQGDLLSAYNLSHGDTAHIVLLPGSPKECFDFAQTCFDLSERMQTLVLVLSELDLGMNNWVSEKFEDPQTPLDRGKVLSAHDLNNLDAPFSRYKDIDNDGVTYRTLPGTDFPGAAYFSRGTSHDENAKYSEDGKHYQELMSRLHKKHLEALKYTPKPVIAKNEKAQAGLIAFGSTDLAIPEVQSLLKHETSYLRLRSLPLHEEVREFILEHDEVFVVEQNRDSQLLTIILNKWPDLHSRLYGIQVFDGLPVSAAAIVKDIREVCSE